MKGIILAGGNGSRLRPITQAISKQLLPVYDKPMIYYPLSVLMLSGIRQVLLITTPVDMPLFQRLLGDGHQLGLELSYAPQLEPKGLADAFIIGREHIGNDSVGLVLGDNIFYGTGLGSALRDEVASLSGCTLFGYAVKDPQRYGVAEVDDDGTLVSIEEKPREPKSNLAITGLYFYDNQVVEIASTLTPSSRGELEITDINDRYRRSGQARLINLGRGTAWLDTGTCESLLEAGQFVQVLEHRQGVRIACVEEVALRMGYISPDQAYSLGKEQATSSYGRYIMEIAQAFSGESRTLI